MDEERVMQLVEDHRIVAVTGMPILHLLNDVWIILIQPHVIAEYVHMYLDQLREEDIVVAAKFFSNVLNTETYVTDPDNFIDSDQTKQYILEIYGKLRWLAMPLECFNLTEDDKIR